MVTCNYVCLKFVSYITTVILEINRSDLIKLYISRQLNYANLIHLS